MKFTNDHNLPEPIFLAATHNRFEGKDEGKLHVTSLIDSPQVAVLKQRHDDSIVKDASEQLYALGGSALHNVVEEFASDDDLVEETMTCNVAGVEIIGTFDLYETKNGGTISDYKETSVWAFALGDQPRWEQQLNVYAYMLRAQGFPVARLQIVARLRDWSKTQSIMKPDVYPQSQIHVIPVKCWDNKEVQDFIMERAMLHKKAINLSDRILAQEMPCSDEERWYRDEKHAVMKQGRKTALRLLDTREEAEEWIVQKEHGIWDRPDTDNGDDPDKLVCVMDKGIYIELRKGKNTRCESYCDAAQFCEQWRAIQNESEPVYG